jgi:hypothetical protein
LGWRRWDRRGDGRSSSRIIATRQCFVNETSFMKIRVFRIDVRQFNANEVLHHSIGFGQTTSKEISDHIDDLLVQPRKSNKFLLEKKEQFQ